MYESSQHFGRLNSVLTIISETGDRPRLVMIRKITTIPGAVLKILLPTAHDTFQIQKPPLFQTWVRSMTFIYIQSHVFKLEYHIQCPHFFIGNLNRVLGIYKRSLAYRENIILRKHLLFHFSKKFHQTRPINEILPTELVP